MLYVNMYVGQTKYILFVRKNSYSFSILYVAHKRIGIEFVDCSGAVASVQGEPDRNVVQETTVSSNRGLINKATSNTDS